MSGSAIKPVIKRGPGRVPDQLPLLSQGSHQRPEDGACVMEYVSILAGRRFSDHPRCTHPALATLARLVNDHIQDSERRRRLALLAPDLAELGGRDPRVTLWTVESCLRGAAMASSPKPVLRQQLAQVRRLLARLDGPGKPTFWRRVHALPHTSSPGWRVQSAFEAFRDHTRRLPPAERDALLVELLETAVRRCRPELARRSTAWTG